MPSPTGVTTLVRKKKMTLRGKRRKKELRRRGTINFQTFFKEPPVDALPATTKTKSA